MPKSSFQSIKQRHLARVASLLSEVGSYYADEWKAWPGGNNNAALNPVEVFQSTDFGLSGNVDWDVGQGGVAGVILETGTTTANNRDTITVRYDTQSPTASEDDTVWIQATQDDDTAAKKRTVFTTVWAYNFANALDGDNNLRFPAGTGTDTAVCGFNWPPENGATRIAGKMEATCSFSPTGINWPARGVSFKFSNQGGGSKFCLRFNRGRIVQAGAQVAGDAVRAIDLNDANWVYDAVSHPGDTQYPTVAKPNKGFRIDAPGLDPSIVLQVAQRGDYVELAEWHDGMAWRQCAIGPRWHVNATAVLPDGAKGGANDHGAGGADVFPNSTPVANAGPNQTVTTGANVQLDGTGSSDADNDSLTYEWTQTGGTAVTLSDSTSPIPTFTAPGAPTTLTFQLIVKDITVGPPPLFHHNPNNGESAPDSVTITVQ